MITGRNDRKGQVVVEFGILIGFFVMFCLAALDYGMFMYTKYNFENGVRNAVRVAVKMNDWAVNRTTNETNIKGIISSNCSRLPSKWRNNLDEDVVISYSPNINNIAYITVEIKDYPYTSLTGFVDALIPQTLSAKAVMRYEY